MKEKGKTFSFPPGSLAFAQRLGKLLGDRVTQDEAIRFVEFRIGDDRVTAGIALQILHEIGTGRRVRIQFDYAALRMFRSENGKIRADQVELVLALHVIKHQGVSPLEFGELNFKTIKEQRNFTFASGADQG